PDDLEATRGASGETRRGHQRFSRSFRALPLVYPSSQHDGKRTETATNGQRDGNGRGNESKARLRSRARRRSGSQSEEQDPTAGLGSQLWGPCGGGAWRQTRRLL